MTPRTRRANLRDIAAESGVSIQTVSRVVRGLDVVAEPTRVRVMEAVNRLNYQPNLAARSLSAHRTGNVHVIDAVPLFHGHLASFVEICQRLADLDLHTSITVLRNAPAKQTLRTLVPAGADGVIVLGGSAEAPDWLAAVSAHLPTVYVGQSGLPEGARRVAVDHKAGAVAAVEHLWGQGSRRIAHLAGPQDWADAVLRLEGYLETCERLGIEPVVLNTGSWDASSATSAVEEMPADTDAIFAANDQLALGCMTALQKLGRSVPTDVRVVGFDDAIGSESFMPALTTVRQDFRGVGESSVRVLNAMINGEPTSDVVLTPTLVVRESSA